MAWAGFSDEDLHRLKQGPSSQSLGRGNMGARRKPQVQQQVRRPAAVNNKNAAPSNIPEDALLTPPTPQSQSSGQRVSSDGPTTNVSQVNHRVQRRNTPECGFGGDNDIKSKANSAENEIAANSDTTNKIPEDAAKDLKEMKPECAIKKELDNLEKYRLQQKLIEDQNKKKKQLLAEAIVKRQKLAKAEATKLMVIQKELAHLDHMLTIDVSLIRDKIEDASREYLEAQKRYEKAEHEFVEAKIDLHKKSESKEQLTEHLYTVIHQNEVRKGKKLTELMSKLTLESGEEDLAALSVSLDLPSMTALDTLQHLPNTLAHVEDLPVSPKQKEPSVTKESADSTTTATNTTTTSIPETSDTSAAAMEDKPSVVPSDTKVADESVVTSSCEQKDVKDDPPVSDTGPEAKETN